MKKLEKRNEELKVENKKLKQQLIIWKKKAKYDKLTNLLRRETFDEIFKKVLNRSYKLKQEASLLFIDIDHFKKINDTYGHDKGDEVLKQISKLLKTQIRDTDIPGKSIGRYGGEEIAVILPNTNKKNSKKVAERLRKSIQKFYKNKEKITISIGLSNFKPKEKPDIEKLYKSADEKLYKAKERGRNRVVS